MSVPVKVCVYGCLVILSSRVIRYLGIGDSNNVIQRFYQVPSLQDLFNTVKAEVILDFLKAAVLYWLLLYAHSICECRSRGAVRCPIWNTSHTADFMIHVRGDATLTIGPYGSAGTCIINYTPPQINVVVMTLGIV